MALSITCTDSRVVPDLITQSQPGDLFICRTVGNQVPPHGSFTDGVASSIEYAVQALGGQHVVVCGHGDCGAMKALLHPERSGRFLKRARGFDTPLLPGRSSWRITKALPTKYFFTS